MYGIFVLDTCVWSAFFAAFISLYAIVARYPSKNDAIIFRVFLLSSSLVMREVDESLLCSAWRTDLESEQMI